MGDAIRVLIVDDHSVFRDALAYAFSACPDFAVVAHHATVSDAIRTLSAEAVDVVLLDHDLGTERGNSLLSWAAERNIPCKFLIVTAGLADADAVWLIRQQVAGIFLKENSLAELVNAVRIVACGGRWLDQPFLKLVMSAVSSGVAIPPAPLFTPREREILRHLVDGCTNKEIGEALCLSEAAVKSGIQRLFDKVGVRSRGHLIRIVLEKHQSCP